MQTVKTVRTTRCFLQEVRLHHLQFSAVLRYAAGLKFITVSATLLKCSRAEMYVMSQLSVFDCEQEPREILNNSNQKYTMAIISPCSDLSPY